MARKANQKAAAVVDVYGYGRVSRVGEREGDSYVSLQLQREKVETMCKLRGWNLAAWYTDENASGSTTDRPNFQAALAALGDGDVLCVAFLNRFSRSLVDTVETEKLIRKAGASLVSCDQTIDTSTSQGRMIFNIVAAINQQFVEESAEKFADARSAALRRGVYSCKAPFGYLRDPSTRRLVKVEREAKVVRTAFDLRAAGMASTEIAKTLNEKGLHPRKAPTWTDRGVLKLFPVETYTGDIVEKGEIIFAGAHEAIVPRKIWEKVQSTAPTGKVGSTPSLLSSIARCAGCSYVLKAQKSGNGTRTYRCKKHHSGGTCPAPASINEPLLDAYVTAAFYDLVKSDHSLDVTVSGTSDEVEREIEDARNDLDETLESDIAGMIGAKKFREIVMLKQGRLDAALAARRKTQRAELPHIGFANAAEMFGTLPVEKQRDVLRKSFEGVFVKAGHAPSTAPDESWVFVGTKGEVDVELPVRGRLASVTEFVFPTDTPDEVGALAA